MSEPEPKAADPNDRLVCAPCGVRLGHYGHVGYDGPAARGKPDPRNEACASSMDWMVLCRPCAENADAERAR
ncbi:MAG: hypothetical protein EA420_02155 [Candidatus Competibacteraceae bacterium]|nr:MAG: hypothetical protein EA420_02155 [Candidatus Competibacteraceae bacterium]